MQLENVETKIGSSFFHPPVSKADKALAIKQIHQLKSNVKQLSTEVNALRTTMNSRSCAGRVLFALGPWRVRAAEKLPISNRLECYQKILNLSRDIRNHQRSIKELEKATKSRFRRLVDKAIDVFSIKRSEYAVEEIKVGGRLFTLPSPGAPVTNWFLPIRLCNTLFFGLKDLFVRARDIQYNVTRTSELRTLLKESSDRLAELEAKPTTEEIAQEIALLRDAGEVLQHQLNKIPMVETLGAMAFRGAILAIDVATATVLSIPFGIIFTTLGALATCDNIRTSAMDFFLTRRFTAKAVEQYCHHQHSLKQIVTNKELFPEGSEELLCLVEATQVQIACCHSEVSRIDRALHRNIRDPRHVNAFKEARQMALADVDAAMNQLVEAVAERASRGELAADRLLEALKANRLSVESAKVLGETVIPYIRERVVTKAINEVVRGFFDALMIAATIMTIVGVATTVGGGSGFGLIAIAGILGLVGEYGQIGADFMIRKLRAFQMRGSHISRKAFGPAVMDQLKKEVANWENLVEAGLTQFAVASVMFRVLGKNYNHIPKDWGPREWAESLINDIDGAEKNRYLQALALIKKHDAFGVIHRVFLWPGQRLYRWWLHRKDSGLVA